MFPQNYGLEFCHGDLERKFFNQNESFTPRVLDFFSCIRVQVVQRFQKLLLFLVRQKEGPHFFHRCINLKLQSFWWKSRKKNHWFLSEHQKSKIWNVTKSCWKTLLSIDFQSLFSPFLLAWPYPSRLQLKAQSLWRRIWLKIVQFFLHRTTDFRKLSKLVSVLDYLDLQTHVLLSQSAPFFSEVAKEDFKHVEEKSIRSCSIFILHRLPNIPNRTKKNILNNDYP